MSSHSPTPWRVGGLTFYNPGNEQTIIAANSDFSIANVRFSKDWGVDGATRDANADYICLCVNSHEALVEALKDMTETCKAAMRVIANIDGGELTGRDVDTMERRFADEVKRAGVGNGVGLRAQQALKLAEATHA